MAFTKSGIEFMTDIMIAAGEVDRILTHNNGDLVAAVRAGNEERVERLLESGADPNEAYVTNVDSIVGLHQCAIDNLVRATAALLKHGAKVDKTTKQEKMTPLHYACRWGNIEVAELLLSNKANVNAKESSGQTPLMYTAKARGRKQLARLLMEYGADPRIRNNLPRKWGKTAADMSLVAKNTVHEVIDGPVIGWWAPVAAVHRRVDNTTHREILCGLFLLQQRKVPRDVQYIILGYIASHPRPQSDERDKCALQ